MQIHPYVGSHQNRRFVDCPRKRIKNFMPSAKFSMCRGLIAVDSMGTVLVNLVGLGWTPAPRIRRYRY